jgi:hypothetical protein
VVEFGAPIMRLGLGLFFGEIFPVAVGKYVITNFHMKMMMMMMFFLLVKLGF